MLMKGLPGTEGALYFLLSCLRELTAENSTAHILLIFVNFY